VAEEVTVNEAVLVAPGARFRVEGETVAVQPDGMLLVKAKLLSAQLLSSLLVIETL
jgi:hypothetical protein